jgi:adenylate kinase
VYISTGELIRNEIEADTCLGKIALPFIEKGDVVPDEIAIRLIESKIMKHPKSKGFIFKGFPSTIVQAYILDGFLRRMSNNVSMVMELSVPTLQSIKRLSARANTTKRRIYDMDTEVIVHRLEVYENHTLPVVDYYRKQGKLIHIDGVGSDEQVYNRLADHVRKTVRKIR